MWVKWVSFGIHVWSMVDRWSGQLYNYCCCKLRESKTKPMEERKENNRSIQKQRETQKGTHFLFAILCDLKSISFITTSSSIHCLFAQVAAVNACRHIRRISSIYIFIYKEKNDEKTTPTISCKRCFFNVPLFPGHNASALLEERKKRQSNKHQQKHCSLDHRQPNWLVGFLGSDLSSTHSARTIHPSIHRCRMMVSCWFLSLFRRKNVGRISYSHRDGLVGNRPVFSTPRWWHRKPRFVGAKQHHNFRCCLCCVKAGMCSRSCRRAGGSSCWCCCLPGLDAVPRRAAPVPTRAKGCLVTSRHGLMGNKILIGNRRFHCTYLRAHVPRCCCLFCSVLCSAPVC